MKYLVNPNLNESIKSVLEHIDESYGVDDVIDDTNINILYINATLPNRLFDVVDANSYRFKTNHQLMQSFNYQKVNDLVQLKSLVAEGHIHLVIIEDLQQIIKLTNLEYDKLNGLIVEVLTIIKRRIDSSFIVDLIFNRFIDLNCDEL